MRPQRNQVYTFEELTQLEHQDSPSLCFFTPDRHQTVIQNDHMTDEEMLSIPNFKDSKWTYIRTSNEWIPIYYFYHDDDHPITEFVDTVETGDDLQPRWSTFKLFPREYLS